MTEETVTVSGENATMRSGAPMHLWIVGVLALIWNGFGAADYFLSRTHNDVMLRAMMPELNPQIIWNYVDAMPLVQSIGWGLGVWSALAATLLLLGRNRHAVTFYALSLLGMALSFGYQFLVAPPAPAGMDDPVMTLVVVVIGVALFFYARAMRARGVLR